MGSLHRFVAEKLLIPLLLNPSVDIESVEADLESRFGPIDIRSAPIAFDFTRYYENEMGPGLTRYILSFERLIDPEALASIKVETNRIEERYAHGGARRVNLDPGLLGLRRLILASTKDNGRRIPLTLGIYAEITLIYVHGDYQPLDWTYPDFRTREYRDHLLAVRERYRLQLREK
jgi:hypothetical protein